MNRNLELSPADPASPPDTPVASPDFLCKDRQAAIDQLANVLAQDPIIRPYGSGHQFSYCPLEMRLSPRSSSSSEADTEYSIGGDSFESASVISLSISVVQPLRLASAGVSTMEPPELDTSGDADVESDSESEAESDKPRRVRLAYGSATSIPEGCDFEIHFTIEEMDPMDSECEGLEVIYPTKIESESDAETPRRRQRRGGLDQGMMKDLENLNCSNEASDDDDEDGEGAEFRRRRQELRRLRRASMSSSIGKRTHSELSDSDDNDCALDVNEAGSSARRLRRRVHRSSLLSQDPLAPRIDELKEPNSSKHEYANEMRLAQGLPDHAVETMDTDSS
ncbi:hypothetical protein ACQKWADRAFT_316048 [Trichoderma austrokoningii]